MTGAHALELLLAAFFVTASIGAAQDFIVFGAGLVAGAVIVVAIRRDIPAGGWDGDERRKAPRAK